MVDKTAHSVMITHARCCRARLCIAYVVEGKKRREADPAGVGGRADPTGLGTGDVRAVTIGVDTDVSGDISSRPVVDDASPSSTTEQGEAHGVGDAAAPPDHLGSASRDLPAPAPPGGGRTAT